MAVQTKESFAGECLPKTIERQVFARCLGCGELVRGEATTVCERTEFCGPGKTHWLWNCKCGHTWCEWYDEKMIEFKLWLKERNS